MLLTTVELGLLIVCPLNSWGVVELPPNGLVDFLYSAIYPGMDGAILSHVLVFGEIIYTRGFTR